MPSSVFSWSQSGTSSSAHGPSHPASLLCFSLCAVFLSLSPSSPSLVLQDKGQAGSVSSIFPAAA